jgi:hypothetical protein
VYISHFVDCYGVADYPGPYLMSYLWGVTGVDEITAL